MAHRFETLDSFRGIAALFIAVFHFPLIFWGAEFPALRHAYVVTNFFFALSGFILMAAYSDKLRSGPAFRIFLSKRLVRLLPLHLLMTAAVVFLPFVTYGTDLVLTYLMTGQYAGDVPPLKILWRDFWVHLFFLQGFGLLTELTLNFPAWSLGVIFFCSVVVGALLVTLKRYSGWIFAVIVAITAVVLVCQAPHQFSSTYDYGVARGALHFFTGALVYLLWQKYKPAIRWGRWAVTVQAMTLVLALAFMVAAQPTSELALLNPFVCAMILMAFSVDNGDFHASLSHPFFRWLSLRSYSMFMTQAVLLFIGHQTKEWTDYFHATAFTGHLFGTLALLAYLAALMGLSDLAYRKVEKPLAARLLRRALPRAAASGSRAI